MVWVLCPSLLYHFSVECGCGLVRVGMLCCAGMFGKAMGQKCGFHFVFGLISPQYSTSSALVSHICTSPCGINNLT